MSLDRKAFFEHMEQQGLALTFDDVRLVTARSHVSTKEIDITSKFSKNVELSVPILSAAMDTVTTAQMAVAMAKLGGMGVIHAGLSPGDQAKEVKKVKHVLNGCIERPISVNVNDTMGDVLRMCNERDFDFRTFPVVDESDGFVGILTQNDFDFNFNDLKAPVKKIMTTATNVYTALPNISVKKAFKMMKDNKKKTLPLITKDGKVGGMYILSDVVRLTSGNPEEYNLDSSGRLRVAAAVPTDEGAIERIEKMIGYLDVAVIDSAQGDSDYAFKTLKQIKNKFPNLDVVVGNISSGESAKKLVKAGADGLKIGQGPGSICTTRIETGIGAPQITAIYECARAIKGSSVPICADGGINNPGDISLAIAAGASSIMTGSKLAGTKESPGSEILDRNGKMVKFYRGMGSPSAMRDSEASRKRYGAEDAKGTPLSEGVESYVPYKGSVDNIIDHYAKALRKSMSYVGSPNIKTHQTKARFVRITNAGFRESKPHDVDVISD